MGAWIDVTDNTHWDPANSYCEWDSGNSRWHSWWHNNSGSYTPGQLVIKGTWIDDEVEYTQIKFTYTLTGGDPGIGVFSVHDGSYHYLLSGGDGQYSKTAYDLSWSSIPEGNTINRIIIRTYDSYGGSFDYDVEVYITKIELYDPTQATLLSVNEAYHLHYGDTIVLPVRPNNCYHLHFADTLYAADGNDCYHLHDADGELVLAYTAPTNYYWLNMSSHLRAGNAYCHWISAGVWGLENAVSASGFLEVWDEDSYYWDEFRPDAVRVTYTDNLPEGYTVHLNLKNLAGSYDLCSDTDYISQGIVPLNIVSNYEIGYVYATGRTSGGERAQTGTVTITAIEFGIFFRVQESYHVIQSSDVDLLTVGRPNSVVSLQYADSPVLSAVTPFWVSRVDPQYWRPSSFWWWDTAGGYWEEEYPHSGSLAIREKYQYSDAELLTLFKPAWAKITYNAYNYETGVVQLILSFVRTSTGASGGTHNILEYEAGALIEVEYPYDDCYINSIYLHNTTVDTDCILRISDIEFSDRGMLTVNEAYHDMYTDYVHLNNMFTIESVNDSYHLQYAQQIILVANVTEMHEVKFYQCAIWAEGSAHGGAINLSEEIDAENVGQVFDDVSDAQRLAGDTSYRKIYVRNASELNHYWPLVKCWINDVAGYSSENISIALGTDTDVQTDAESYDFYEPTYSAHVNALNIGTLFAGDSAAIWIKRVIPAGSAPSHSTYFELGFGS